FPMNGPHRVFIWAAALFGALLPYVTLDFFLPDEVLRGGHIRATHILGFAIPVFPVPDKLVPEFSFIGVAIFISCFPDWLSDSHFRSFKYGRKRWIIFFRAASGIAAILSLFYFIRISLHLNGVVDPRFVFDLESNKLALLLCVVAAGLTSFAAIFFHLGRPQ